ncbi:phage tail tube protein [Lactiplantibacillus herbarum]|uniref:phage tail tube protein n=1 Tax=Lactiplantibacillus herbarum TaxID=1670446 RepID=UPI00064F9A51|nr:phage tail tube protein [Lactiplantibacillus herbarum]
MATTSQFLNGQDTISSKEATVFMNYKGQNINMMELIELSADVEKNKEKVKVIGDRWSKNKTTSMAGKGKLSGYLISSNWIEYGLDYANGGADMYFDITATINDNTSSTGTQTVLLKNVNLDKVPILDLKADDKVLEWDTDFTFDGVKLVTPFNDIK